MLLLNYMGGYETGLKLLESYLAENKRTVVLMGGSASYVEDDLAALGSHPHIVKSLPRQSLTDYVEDLKKIAAANTEQGITVVEDHSLSNGKMIFIAEHFPDIEVISIVGQKQITNFPNSRVLVVDPLEAKRLHGKRSTLPADKR